jgi:RNA polymerase sigma-70 factor (ECF subfamily)
MDRDKIITSLRERILAFATLRVSRAQAEDLTQEVLVVLHEKYPNVADLTQLVPLAFQVLRFKMLDTHRNGITTQADGRAVSPGDEPIRRALS